MADKEQKLETLADAHLLLTGRELETNNNSNVFGQMDRAYRQSTDDELKRKIAKKFGFDPVLHASGPRT